MLGEAFGTALVNRASFVVSALRASILSHSRRQMDGSVGN